MEVTSENVHDSVAWDAIYEQVTSKYDVQFATMDAGYKTPRSLKKVLNDHKTPILPYARSNGKKDGYHPWDYTYDPVNDYFVCPQGKTLRQTTTDKDGKRCYRSTPKECKNCPSKALCGANEKGQKLYTMHI